MNYRDDHMQSGFGFGADLAGHNRASASHSAAQWQTPHKPGGEPAPDHAHGEPDLDLVEAAFAESFATASDPTSFLRLARIPFEAYDITGKKLSMLRVEIEMIADVGSVTPSLGGGPMRYDPLPAQMVTRRRKLCFVYFDGRTTRKYSLAEVRELNGE